MKLIKFKMIFNNNHNDYYLYGNEGGLYCKPKDSRIIWILVQKAQSSFALRKEFETDVYIWAGDSFEEAISSRYILVINPDYNSIWDKINL